MATNPTKYRRITGDSRREKRVRDYLDLRALLRNAFYSFQRSDGEDSHHALIALLNASNPDWSYWASRQNGWTWASARGYWATRFYERSELCERVLIQPSEASDAMWTALALAFRDSEIPKQVERLAAILLRCRRIKEKATFACLKQGLEDWRLRLLLEATPEYTSRDTSPALDAALHSTAAGRMLMDKVRKPHKA